MSSITAVVVAASPPYVQLDAVLDTPGTVASYSITRATQGVTTTIFIGGAGEGVASVADFEAPFGVSIIYSLIIQRTGGAQEIVQSAPVTITGVTGCWISNPSTHQALMIEVQAWPSRVRAGRSTALAVLGRQDPVGIVDVHTAPAGQITFLTRTQSDLTTLQQILTGSGVALLRSHDPTSTVWTEYGLVGDVGESRLVGYTDTDWRFLTPVEWQKVAPVPAAAQASAATLQQLSTLGATLQDLANLRPTLLGLAQLRP